MSRTRSLFCSVCGCYYMSARAAKRLGFVGIGRKPGGVCGDMSGGWNTPDSPCPGILVWSAWTSEVRERQRASMGRRYPAGNSSPGSVPSQDS